MKLTFNLVIVLLVIAACSAEVVDRMVAVVNRQVILQSELEQAARVEFLLQGRSLDQLTPSEMQGVLDRMIDQALLQQQIVNTPLLDANQEEIASRIHEVRSQIPGATDGQGWQSMLASYGVTEADVEKQVAAQLRILRFIDLRFRSLAHVDRASISNYYTDKLLPELRKQGAPEPPLQQVSDKIEKILTEQRIDELLNSWLQTLRSQAHIQKMRADSMPSSGTTP
ncbi:MAG TPA: SurA N-terminal domain-containing protein [Candidatus Angelobacter sp.]